jgi:hypothetical protein
MVVRQRFDSRGVSLCGFGQPCGGIRFSPMRFNCLT